MKAVDTNVLVYAEMVLSPFFLGAILASPSLLLLAETSRHAEMMQAVLGESGAAGNHVHDAHVAALCREHGIDELVTGNADFYRFTGFRVTNPFR